MRVRRVLVLLTVCAGLTLSATPAGASTAHWDRRPGVGRVQVFLVDRTGGAFPVAQAAAQWNRSNAIGFTSVTSCPAYRACVGVYVKPLPVPYVGYTTSAIQNGYVSAVHIDMSPDPMSPGERLAAMCHELGHALGLGHRPLWSTTSCMTPVVLQNVTAPDNTDFNDLVNIYAQAAP